jgi:hypothetical protein
MIATPADPDEAPASTFLDLWVRRFGRTSYALVILLMYLLAATAMGLASCVMGDVIIGADATLLPHSVLLPGSRVGPGETWGGVPARLIPRDEMECLKDLIRGEG